MSLGCADATGRGGTVGRRWMLDLLFVLGLMVAMNLFMAPEQPGFPDMTFNPYFIPVLLLAVRYGAKAGFVAGLASSVTVLAGVWSGGSRIPDMVLPALLVAAGTLAGLACETTVKDLRLTRERLHHLQKEMKQAEGLLDARERIVRELQARIEVHATPLEILHRLSRGLCSRDPDEILRSLLEFTVTTVRAERAAVYEVRGDQAVLKMSHVRTGRTAFAAKRPLSELSGLALRSNRVLSVLDLEAAGMDARHSDALLCGPLGNGGAFLVVEEMPLSSFSRVAVARFASLVDWANHSLALAAGEHGIESLRMECRR
ncbi:MAG: hypothetical protein HY716_01245 [Planctomycetes bacterium]|nr:hypothetical protein [Planctomycetota bacterium]